MPLIKRGQSPFITSSHGAQQSRVIAFPYPRAHAGSRLHTSMHSLSHQGTTSVPNI